MTYPGFSMESKHVQLDRKGPLCLGRCGAGLAIVVVITASCSWTKITPAQPSEPGASTAVAGAESAPELSGKPNSDAEQPSEFPVDMADSVLIHIDQVVGASPATAAVVFAPIVDSLPRCAPDKPGMITVNVVSLGDRTALEVASSTVGETTRKCVLAALSVMDVAKGLPNEGSPSDQPRSFSSSLTISW
jgi:hypothetical protein